MPSGTLVCSLAILALAPAVALRGAGPKPDLSRRGAIAAASAALIAGHSTRSSADMGKLESMLKPRPADRPGYDPYAQWSLFGIAPPPIKGRWSREELKAQALAGEVRSIQIAPQHDCLWVFNTNGHRYVCMIQDAELPGFLFDMMGPDGAYPFTVLPLDPNRAKVRDVAGQLLNVAGALWVADLADLLPWDSTPYGSWEAREKAREEARNGGKKPGKPLKPLADRLLGRTPKGARTASKRKGEGEGLASNVKDEALRRVFGLTSTDPTTELKAKLKATAQQIKAEYEPAWVTPLTVEGNKLPTLEELFLGPFRVWTDGQWAQYIRAHPEGEVARRWIKRKGKLVMSRIVFDEGDRGVWRRCPQFSALYGHDVYVLKMRLAEV